MYSFTIGIDVGGTFTDLVSIDESGATIIAKSPTTPADQSIGVMAGLDVLAHRHGLTLRELLGRTERIVHGTTAATNALLERKGAKTALLTTAGHRDVLEMREGLKDDRYDLRSVPPEPLVPRHLRFGVKERMQSNGTVHVPLDQASLGEAIVAVRESGATAVAVCFLHAYRNPAHELEAVERLKRELPDVYLSRSSDVLPQIREYERVSTTVVNAYVGRIVERYLNNLRDRLKEAGLTGSLFIMLSHGGMAPVEEAGRLAAATVLSGPAGGVAGARRCAQMLGVPDLIPFDVGGTSTDISLIANAQAFLSSERGLAGQRIALKSLDIMSIAAGGGSIAGWGVGGGFHVGPESAGAVPGPACYGGGGVAATVTDANLILGYLGTERLLGGSKRLDVAAAHDAIDREAGRLGLTREETAQGIYRLVNLQMAEGVRLMTLRRGVDPRKFALLSFGGAAGPHAADVARELEIPRVIVPTVASVLSAWGMLSSDLRYETACTHVGDKHALDDERIRSGFAEIERDARERLGGWYKGDISIERSAEMRYGEQVFEIDVPLDGLDWHAPDLVNRIHERFHARHEELYTYASRDQEVILVNARVAAIGTVPAPAQLSEHASPRAARTMTERTIFSGGDWRMVPVYQIDSLVPGETIAGPAVLEMETTTIIAHAGDRVVVNAMNWLEIEIGQATVDLEAAA